MMLDRRTVAGVLGLGLSAPAFAQTQTRTIALLFDSLVSPFWVAALEVMRADAARRGWSVSEAVSNQDDNRQYQQVLSMTHDANA